MDDIEMKNFNPEEEEEEGEAETNVNESFYDYDDDELDYEYLDDRTKRLLGSERRKMLEENPGETDQGIKEIIAKQGIRTKREITFERKKFFRTHFKQEVLIKDGPASKLLIGKSALSVSPITGKINGILFNDIRVVAKKGKGFGFSTDKKYQTQVNDFKELMEKANLEHAKTANGSIENIIGLLPGPIGVNGIKVNVIDQLQDEMIMARDTIESDTQISEEELRELGGLLKIDKLMNLDGAEIAVKYWADEAEKIKDNPRKKALLLAISNTAKLKADELRLKNNMLPMYQITRDMIENDDLTRFERFKEWSKNNMGVTAAVGISIAGIITTIIMAGRKGVTSAAKATGALGKAVAKLGKAALPILVPLANLLVTALKWGVKGLSWLSKNLWILAIGLTYILFTKTKKYINK